MPSRVPTGTVIFTDCWKQSLALSAMRGAVARGGRTRALVTGSAAGFIGYHLCRRLLADGQEVLGLDGYDRILRRAIERSSGMNYS